MDDEKGREREAGGRARRKERGGIIEKGSKNWGNFILYAGFGKTNPRVYPSFTSISCFLRDDKRTKGSWRRLSVNRAIIRRFARDFRPNECRQPGQYRLTNIIPH